MKDASMECTCYQIDIVIISKLFRKKLCHITVDTDLKSLLPRSRTHKVCGTLLLPTRFLTSTKAP